MFWNPKFFGFNSIVLLVLTGLFINLFTTDFYVRPESFIKNPRVELWIIFPFWLISLLIEFYRSIWEFNKQSSQKDLTLNLKEKIFIEMQNSYEIHTIDVINSIFQMVGKAVLERTNLIINIHIFLYDSFNGKGRLIKKRQYSLKMGLMPKGNYLEFLDLIDDDYFGTCQAFKNKTLEFQDLVKNPPVYRGIKGKQVDKKIKWVLAAPILSDNIDHMPLGVLTVFGHENYFEKDSDKNWFSELIVDLSNTISLTLNYNKNFEI